MTSDPERLPPVPPDPERLQAIRERLQKATPGPWAAGPTPGYLAASQWADNGARRTNPLTIRSPAHTEEIATVWTYLLPTEANAVLIAHAPEDLAYLLNLVEGKTS